jgi:hypothetical protein
LLQTLKVRDSKTIGGEMKRLLIFTIFVLGLSFNISSQTTEFTYQGTLIMSGSPANGNFDFEFLLFDSLANGTQLGSTLARNGVPVTNGAFAVSLDYGNQFPGANRFLEIHVRTAGGGGYTPLAPRQPVTSSPYSIKSNSAENAANATTAANALQLGGVAANQFVVTSDARLSDARNPLSGSANYIQNQNAAPQASTDFNIGGNGTVAGTLSGNIVRASTQFNIGNSRILSNAGSGNLFAGVGAGPINTGPNNTFLGFNAGAGNTTGSGNVFVGSAAGFLNNSSANTFIGSGAGNATSGNSNVFAGASAGQSNTTGQQNSFFGANAGNTNTQGNANTLLGFAADLGSNGLTNATAIGAHAFVSQSNSIVLGGISGINNCTVGFQCADTKVGIGTTSPTERLHVVGNGFFTGNLTANGILSTPIISAGTQYNIGSDRVLGVSGSTVNVPSSNTFLGIDSGTVNNPIGGATLNSFFGAQSGKSNTNGSENSFFGAVSGSSNTTGTGNSYFGDFAGASNTSASNGSFFGSGAGFSNTTGIKNSFFGQQSGNSNVGGSNNSFFGVQAGITNVSGSGNSIFGAGADLASNNLTNATAIGANARVAQSNSLVLGSINGVNGATANTSVGIGTTTPSGTLDVRNNTSSASLSLSSGNGSATLFLTRATAVPSQSAQIAFYSGGTVDFAMGTSQGSAGISDFSIYSYGTNSNVFTINKSSGNVGVGTASPGYRLDVAQDVPNAFASHIRTAGIATGASYGLVVSAGTNSNDTSFHARNQAGTTLFIVRGDGSVGIGTPVPGATLDVVGTAKISSALVLGGPLQISQLSNPGGGSTLCGAGPSPSFVTFCTSSYRYKTNVARYRSGLEVIDRLNPIQFDWKKDGTHDVGLGAEDVEKIDKRLIFYNDKGQVEGVKYDRIGVDLINAVKEQQAQIEALKEEVRSQEEVILDLKSVLCRRNAKLRICKK